MDVVLHSVLPTPHSLDPGVGFQSVNPSDPALLMAFTHVLLLTGSSGNL